MARTIEQILGIPLMNVIDANGLLLYADHILLRKVTNFVLLPAEVT